jgi:copper(I)-binding protein
MLRGFAILLLSVCVCVDAFAHTIKKKGIEIVHPWCYATDGASPKSSAVYMKIKNLTRKADKLLSASASIAEKVVLQAPPKDSATTQRRPAGAITVGGGGELVFGRTGYWFELVNVNKELTAYDSFKLTLVFQNAGKVDIDVLVEEGPEPQEPKHHHHH